MGDVDAKIHIFAAMVTGRGRVASPKLDRLYPGKALILILQEAEWTQDQSVYKEVEKNLHPSPIRY